MGSIPEGSAAVIRRRMLGFPRKRLITSALPAGSEIPEGSSTASTALRDRRYRRLLGVADLVSATVALLVGVPILGNDALGPAVLVALPMVLVVGKITNLYDRDEHLLRKTTLDEAPALFRMATLWTLLTWLAGPLVVEGPLGRDQGLTLWALLFVCMLMARSAARFIARAVSPEERCLVIGDPSAAGLVATKLSENHSIKATVVGRVPLDPDEASGNGTPVLGHLDMLGLVLENHEIDRVVIAPATSDGERMLDAIRVVKALGVRVSVLPSLFEVVGSSVEFDEIDGTTLLGVRQHGLSRSSRAVKRTLDLTAGVIGLALLAPTLALIALAIKIDTRGPVFFRQRRMGRNNVPFEMFKFRTMVDGAEAQKEALMHRNEAGGGLFKIEDDPRITRVGGFLRKTSLDELPQLLNVMRGDMALVGPRPLVIDEDAQIEGWQRRRLLLTPGMTGMWQVLGSARIPLHEMVKLDYRYGANWSLWLDIKILLRTVPFVLGRRGL
jgi:exopolysaccharide biosynthesis polyprenyl glycosylphosphotransferase